MTRRLVPGEKPLYWIGSSLNRAIYTVRFANAVYVLHAFQKKSPHGIATRQSDIALVRDRLKLAQREYEETYG
jgi:phage-related protein